MRQPAAGSRGSAPVGSRGQSPRIFLTLLPIFEHGLQFRFNEITYFLDMLCCNGQTWSLLLKLEGVWLPRMPCFSSHVMQLLTGINRERFAVKN